MNTTVTPNVDPTVQLTEFSFRFKKDSMGNQRPSFKLSDVPVPSAQGVVAILEKGGKELKLLLEVMANTVRSAASQIVSDDENITQETFPFPKITWEAIANQERAERTTISQETWAAFAKDYLEIMPALSGKTPEQLSNAVQVYLKKLLLIKTNKKLLTQLQAQFAIYVENTRNGEEFADIIELLMNRFDTYINSNDVDLIINNL